MILKISGHIITLYGLFILVDSQSRVHEVFSRRVQTFHIYKKYNFVMLTFTMLLQMIWRFVYRKNRKTLPIDMQYKPWLHHLPIISEVKLGTVDLIPYSNPAREKLTVVLGIDNTLVDVTLLDPTRDYNDFEFDAVVHAETNKYRLGIYVRPMIKAFLTHGAEHFDLVLFTSAEQTYARKVMDVIDPNGYIKQRYYRDSCILTNGILTKPIQHLGRSMSRIVHVNSSDICMMTAPDNGIHISRFVGDTGDSAIRQVMNILDHVNDLDDVRPFLIKTYQIRTRLVELGFTPLDEPGGPFHLF
jgi:CTD nuclear envelope phosphatase 1